MRGTVTTPAIVAVTDGLYGGAMLARLILALLLAAFAFPAAAPAACHDAGAKAAHAMPMGEMPPSRDHEATPPHGCIGCVPPSSWIAGPTAAALRRDALPPLSRTRSLDLGTGAPPALPPPRAA